MPRCAFLGMQSPSGYFIDDDLAIRPLNRLGWAVDTIPWNRSTVQWSDYDIVVVRSTWDYPSNPSAFLKVLGQIEASGVQLENPLHRIEWNLRKTYLQELDAKGIPLIPTMWIDEPSPGDVAAALDELAVRVAIMKPVVGANANSTYRVDRDTVPVLGTSIDRTAFDQGVMIQPFVDSIFTEGEISVIFIDGEFSHAVRKLPAEGDFRVQEEHGGSVVSAIPAPQLMAVGKAALEATGAHPLYARVDLVRSGTGDWWLMELELIEPSLHLRSHPEAASRFAEAIEARA